jgi:hypothetical protein
VHGPACSGCHLLAPSSAGSLSPWQT